MRLSEGVFLGLARLKRTNMMKREDRAFLGLENRECRGREAAVGRREGKK